MSCLVFVCLTLIACTAFAASPPAELYSPLVSSKILATAQSRPGPNQYPVNTDRSQGIWEWAGVGSWTSGFFPATLYAMYTRALLCPSTVDNADWVGIGGEFSQAIIPVGFENPYDHDVGFVSIPFVDEVKIHSGNKVAIDAINQYAADLAIRFNPTVGCTRSWNRGDPDVFQVIIDNMMNLDVLFNSHDLTGNTTLTHIAVSHADKTIENHVRPDGSSYHLVEYNTTTGVVIHRGTVQGYADNSTWSRGQAWGIYGFANMHKRTGYQRYIETSRRMAQFFLDHIPSSGIVPWDFNAPAPAPADSSAATIAASGLLLLSQEETLLGNHAEAKHWSDAAITILSNTIGLAWKPSWQSLLSNGTIYKLLDEYDTGIVYGDYYFVEAGNRLVSMRLAAC